MLTILLCALLVGFLFFLSDKNIKSALLGSLVGAGLGLFACLILFAASPTDTRTVNTGVYDLSTEKDSVPTFGFLLDGGVEYFVFAVKEENGPVRRVKIPIGDVIIATHAKHETARLVTQTQTTRPGWELWILGRKNYTSRWLYVPPNSVFKLMSVETIPPL